MCSKGARIIMGWDISVVDVQLIAQSTQVMQVQVKVKQEKKVLLCSIVYADNYYIARRDLWDSLCRHKVFIKDQPW